MAENKSKADDKAEETPKALGATGSTGNSTGPHIRFEAPAKGVRLEHRGPDGKVHTVTAYKPTTVTQLKAQGYRPVEEA